MASREIELRAACSLSKVDGFRSAGLLGPVAVMEPTGGAAIVRANRPTVATNYWFDVGEWTRTEVIAMRSASKVAVMAGMVLAGLSLTAPSYAQGSVKTDIPDSLAKQTRIDEATARATATRRVPNGQIKEVELEREHGRLQYSYDVKVPGHTASPRSMSTRSLVRC
jgi:hypothetical protein